MKKNAVKKITVERGYDVSSYVISCFGGAAGQHACRVANILGIKKREKICNLENTLIIANVFGYHARSFAEKTTSRISIHGSLRYTNPFKSK